MSSSYWAVLLTSRDEIQVKDISAGMRLIHRIPVAVDRSPSLALANAGYSMIGKWCTRPDGTSNVMVKRSK